MGDRPKLKLKPYEPKEQEIQNEILRYLNRLPGCFAWRNNSTGIWDKEKNCYRRTHSIKGVSDIIGCYRGRFLGIEVKRRKGIVSPEQEAFIRTINEHGGIAFVARDVQTVCENLGLAGHDLAATQRS